MCIKKALLLFGGNFTVWGTKGGGIISVWEQRGPSFCVVALLLCEALIEALLLCGA